MELKVVCLCGQKYKFDVEPVNSSMPFNVNCPVCGHDGTNLANALLMQMPAAPPIIAVPVPTAVATAAAVPAGLRINRAAEPPTAPPLPAGTSTATAVAIAPAPPPRRPVPSMPTQSRSAPKYMQDNKAIMNNSFIMGILGAILGAVVAVGLMVGFTELTQFRFPLFGTIMGAIIGFGARLLYRGTDFTLGAMCAVIAFITITATLMMMFGILGLLFSVMSIVIGTGFAFKIASG